MDRYLLPKPGSVWFDSRTLMLPAIYNWKAVGRREAFNNPPSDFPQSFMSAQRDEPICLNLDGRLRISACAGLIISTCDGPKMVLGQFDAGHPKMAGLLTVPGGAVEPTDKSILAAAVREAFEEVMFLENGKVMRGHRADQISVTGLTAAQWQIEANAKQLKAQFSEYGLEIAETEQLKLPYLVHGVAVDIFPENDSLEICYFLTLEGYRSSTMNLVDGEILPNGKRRDMPVYLLGPDDGLPGPATPKTERFFETFRILVNNEAFSQD